MFKLEDDFVEQYSTKEPQWGYASGPNSIGEITFFRTYSRVKPDGTNEQWYETVRRVVEGTYTLQRDHMLHNKLAWSDAKAQRSAQEMYERMFTFKFLPPGRGLWMMGTDYLMERRNSACLFNCAFVSTRDEDPAKPYAFLMDMSMLGVGVGFDTDGAGTKVVQPKEESYTYVIPDSREGWVESVRLLLSSYFHGGLTIEFDYSLIRPAGLPINGFGGTSEGPDDLIGLHRRLRNLLSQRDMLTSRDVVDIMNMIGACVVAGNVRRSAEIALGYPDDADFVSLKDWTLPENQERMNFETGWGNASNNSLYAHVGMDYESLAQRIGLNGEPGLFYLDVARAYGRTSDEPDYKDMRVKGVNPCAEIALESYELCNLVEVFPTNHDTVEDLLRTIKYAYLYSKSVTLMPTNWPETNAVMLRNRRIGASMSGIVQALHKMPVEELIEWLEAGYAEVQRRDKQYSEWFCIRESIRTTTVKPSGTVSLLAGVTPGVHHPVADTYIRRISIGARNPLVDKMRLAGYHVEPKNNDPSTMIVSMPVRGMGLPTEYDVTVEEKAAVATMMAEHWADNAVSVTVTFQESERDKLADVLRENEGRWKTVSMLPIFQMDTAYPQMPYEPISEAKYEELTRNLQRVDLNEFFGVDGEGEAGCTTDKCEVKLW